MVAEVRQNLGLCVLLSAIGGILEVFATAVLAYPDAKKKQYEAELLEAADADGADAELLQQQEEEEALLIVDEEGQQQRVQDDDDGAIIGNCAMKSSVDKQHLMYDKQDTGSTVGSTTTTANNHALSKSYVSSSTSNGINTTSTSTTTRTATTSSSSPSNLSSSRSGSSSSSRWTNPRLHKLCLLCNLILQCGASMIGNLLSTWYGPISIVGPTFLCSQLLTNMILYGSVLGIECFTKDMKIGTIIIVTAAVLLPVVGPQIQNNQNIIELMTSWYSYTWNAMLLLAMICTGMILLVRTLSNNRFFPLHSMKSRYIVLLIARSTSFAVNLSYSKVFALNPNYQWLIASIVLKLVSGGIMTGSIVIQSTSVSQNTFVPLNATLLILVNAITGIIVWEDNKVITSNLGYGTVFVQLIVGNYLLLGEIDLFGPQNLKYGTRHVFKRIISRIIGSKDGVNDDVDGDDGVDVVVDAKNDMNLMNPEDGEKQRISSISPTNTASSSTTASSSDQDLEKGAGVSSPDTTTTTTVPSPLPTAVPASAPTPIASDAVAAWLSSTSSPAGTSAGDNVASNTTAAFHSGMTTTSSTLSGTLQPLSTPTLQSTSGRPTPLRTVQRAQHVPAMDCSTPVTPSQMSPPSAGAATPIDAGANNNMDSNAVWTSTNYLPSLSPSSLSGQPSLVHRRQGHTTGPVPSPSASPQALPVSPSSPSSILGSSRPISLSQRSSTVGVASSSSRSMFSSAGSPRSQGDSQQQQQQQLLQRPTVTTKRSQTTGMVEAAAASTTTTAAHRRREQYFGASPSAYRLRQRRRKEAWGQIFGVDPDWLQQRQSMRHMETIVETSATRTSTSNNNNTTRLQQTTTGHSRRWLT